MKVYNFDKVISRDGTYSAKYNNKGHDIIPLSVADMDIPVADFIVSELSVANQKGIYGYTLLSDDWQHSGINAITRGRSTLNTLFFAHG
ncbi:hypothetical protein MLZ62_23555 [Escherichia coli]|nr:hypothetical protein [Escherichia coli]